MLINRHVYRAEATEDGDDTGGGKADEVVDEKPKDDEPEVSADIIAKAEKMGWTPKDKFRGDPAKWRPADEFVERGENMLPLVQAQVRRQEREINELKQSMRDLGDYHSKTAQREYGRALANLKAQRAEAIKAGDGAAFDAVDEQIDSLKENIKANEQPRGDKPDPEFNDWLSKNKWAEDPKLQAYGLAVADEIKASGTKATGLEMLDLVAKQIKKDFPEKFENPRRTTAAAVEGGAGPRRSTGKSYSDLPAEARAACDRMAKNGYADKPKEMAAFKAEYVKSYFSDQE